MSACPLPLDLLVRSARARRRHAERTDAREHPLGAQLVITSSSLVGFLAVLPPAHGTYQRMFEGMDIAMPSATLAALALGDFVAAWQVPLALGGAALVWTIARHPSSALARAATYGVTGTVQALVPLIAVAWLLPLRELISPV